jgi:hypothetical protein
MRYWDEKVTGPDITLYIVINSALFKQADVEALAKQIKDTGIKFQPKLEVVTNRPKNTEQNIYELLATHLLAFYETYILERDLVRLSKLLNNYATLASARQIDPKNVSTMATICKISTKLGDKGGPSVPETTVTTITKRKILAATAVKTRKPSQNAAMNNLSAPDVSTSCISPTAILMS